MAILVVGSVAFDTIETPQRQGSTVWAARQPTFPLAASYFTDVRVIAVVGEDFGRGARGRADAARHRYARH